MKNEGTAVERALRATQGVIRRRAQTLLDLGVVKPGT